MASLIYDVPYDEQAKVTNHILKSIVANLTACDQKLNLNLEKLVALGKQ